jgi:hypothetical protein
MELLSERREVVVSHHFLIFTWRDPERVGAGFAFPCTATGVVLVDELDELGRGNLARCQSGALPVVAQGVRGQSEHHVEVAVGRCIECWRPIRLEGPVNTCPCGREYDLLGRQLAAQVGWGDLVGAGGAAPPTPAT